MTSRCALCSEGFEAVDPGQRYCSAKHKSAAYRSRARAKKSTVHDKVCMSCDKPFQTRDSGVKYCSADCYPVYVRACVTCGIEFKTRDKTAKRCSPLGECFVTAECIVCTQEFTTSEPEQKTCSGECRGQLKRVANREQGLYGTSLSAAQQRRYDEAEENCPTKTKMRFTNSQDAFTALREVGDTRLEVYICQCGYIHLGHDYYDKHNSISEDMYVDVDIK